VKEEMALSTETNPHYGMVIDLRRCVGCHACTVSCKMENSIAEGFFRSWVVEADKGQYPDVTRVKLPRLCNQCENPSCTDVCPTGATYRDETGIIVIDKDICIGCGYCVASCPYDMRYIDPKSETADKCDFCFNRTKAGLIPSCVSTCIAHARFFGDLNDPDSTVAKLIKEHNASVLRPDLERAPSVYYIGLEESKIDEVLPNDIDASRRELSALGLWKDTLQPLSKGLMGLTTAAVVGSIAVNALTKGGKKDDE
jgi:tetrathionate reductase subunit B